MAQKVRPGREDALKVHPPAVTLAAMDQLLAFLPIFDAPGFEAAESWSGGEKRPGFLTWPYPNYSDAVTEFFNVASQEVWADCDYASKDAGSWFENPSLIDRASLDDIKTLLTYIVRGEKFCDGHVEGMIRAGHVQSVLRRLAVLRDDEHVKMYPSGA